MKYDTSFLLSIRYLLAFIVCLFCVRFTIGKKSYEHTMRKINVSWVIYLKWDRENDRMGKHGIKWVAVWLLDLWYCPEKRQPEKAFWGRKCSVIQFEAKIIVSGWKRNGTNENKHSELQRTIALHTCEMHQPINCRSAFVINLLVCSGDGGKSHEA